MTRRTIKDDSIGLIDLRWIIRPTSCDWEGWFIYAYIGHMMVGMLVPVVWSGTSSPDASSPDASSPGASGPVPGGVDGFVICFHAYEFMLSVMLSCSFMYLCHQTILGVVLCQAPLYCAFKANYQ